MDAKSHLTDNINTIPQSSDIQQQSQTIPSSKQSIMKLETKGQENYFKQAYGDWKWQLF
ncbi:hypothetical protein BY996DRAFT_6549268 [Phakopsora pachyrhizi]|nr:hypothetical protein BY996DRAFT_6549268 [Phakopsora pachyrhizi]